MSAVTRSTFAAVAAALSVQLVLAQDIGEPGFVPLYEKKFPYNQIVSYLSPYFSAFSMRSLTRFSHTALPGRS